MALRSAQDQLEVSPTFVASPTPSPFRAHRGQAGRGAHRAAHAAARSERRRWLLIGAGALAGPFAVALIVLEMVR